MIKCDYCGEDAQLVKGNVIYSGKRLRHLWKKQYWYCEPCSAWVGCHRGTSRPLGRLANNALRRAKINAHEAFDRIWKGGVFSRAEAYRWLAEQLHILPEECHIARFDLERCRRVVVICRGFDPGEVQACRQRWSKVGWGNSKSVEPRRVT